MHGIENHLRPLNLSGSTTSLTPGRHDRACADGQNSHVKCSRTSSAIEDDKNFALDRSSEKSPKSRALQLFSATVVLALISRGSPPYPNRDTTQPSLREMISSEVPTRSFVIGRIEFRGIIFIDSGPAMNSIAVPTDKIDHVGKISS